jgi:hypothetical protein
MQLSLSQALKEWAVAVNALGEGKTIMLLRKGGIKEQQGSFQVSNAEVLLYPTYEHQQPFLLKPEYADLVQTVPSGWHPDKVSINSWAKITQIMPVSDEAIVKALLPFHIWNEQFIHDRLKWKPRQPLYILLLRTYKLWSIQDLPYRNEYGGCKSWIDVNAVVSLQDAEPVLNDSVYSQLVAEIQGIVEHRA